MGLSFQKNRKRSLFWSSFWVTLALLFNAGVYFFQGEKAAFEFFTGYLIEKSLSIDNLFVFLMIFSHFRIREAQQRRILHWGILGAIVFRMLLIVAGVNLLGKFHGFIYLLGAFLLFTGIKLSLDNRKEPLLEQSIIFRFCKRFIPFSSLSDPTCFFLKEKGKWKATSLFLALLMVEGTDIIFALDSIPAIFAITTDPFIIYTSNIFAILGLRSLYFLLAGFLDKLRYFKYGL
ncbi:MAG: TerC/Alx family metal homeostasis membrane protein, partial [Chlamydiales bacterium]|nr:TerC/Alx family metal homeostasis membrane protein [Chlamydiales bacterium]